MYTALDNAGNTGLMAALKQAGVTLDPVVFPGGYSPLVLGLPDVRRRLLRHRVQAVRDHARSVAGPRPSTRSGWRSESPERAAEPDHRRGVALGQHPHRGHQGGRGEVPDPQGVHQQPAPGQGLHRRRVLRRPRDDDRLRRGVRQAVPVRVLRARREQAVRAPVRRQAVLRQARRSPTTRSPRSCPTTTTAAPTATTAAP